MFEEELANPVEGEEKETPTETPAEEKTNEAEEGSQPEEKKVPENVPYHKDPRWMEMYQKSKRVDDLEEKLSEFEQWKEQQTKSEPAETQIPNWFKKLYGDDPEIYKEYADATRAEKESWKQEFIQEFESKEAEKAESIKRGEEWINDQIQDLKDQGLEFNENELIKVLVEEQLFDKEGNPNFKAGMKFLEATKTEPENPNKKIASMTRGGTAREPGTKTYSTSEDLRNTSWNELID